MFVSDMIARHGTTYTVTRGKNVVCSARGLQNKDDFDGNYIGFVPEQNIQAGDILTNPAGDKIYVSEVKTDFLNDEPVVLKVKCMSPADKQKADELLSLLGKISENQIEPSKGMLSKFADVMERNSWLTGAVASAVLSWLTNSIL